MLRLARGAVAQLAIQRSVSTQLVLHGTAMARGIVDDLELALVVDLVRRSLLPLSYILLLLLRRLLGVRHGFAVSPLGQVDDLDWCGTEERL